MICIALAAIHDLNTKNSMGANVGGTIRTWVKPIEVVKEPDVCSALRNLLLAFPGGGFHSYFRGLFQPQFFFYCLLCKIDYLNIILLNDLLLWVTLLGCISVDGSGDRLFLSDVNHHRIIVFNNNGKILDAVRTLLDLMLLWLNMNFCNRN